jgi:hypothetical protein
MIPPTLEGCCRARHQLADTKRTHQKRHARRLATHLQRPDQANLQEKRVADDRACTPVTLRNLHGKEGVDGSSPPSARPSLHREGPRACVAADQASPDWAAGPTTIAACRPLSSSSTTTRLPPDQLASTLRAAHSCLTSEQSLATDWAYSNRRSASSCSSSSDSSGASACTNA